MRKVALALLVGSAALAPLTLSAQTVPDPEPFYGIPNISLNIPTAAAAPAGVTWQQGAPVAAGQMRTPAMPRRFTAPMAPPMPQPQAQVRVFNQGMAAAPVAPGQHQRVFVVNNGPGGQHMGGQGWRGPGMGGQHMDGRHWDGGHMGGDHMDMGGQHMGMDGQHMGMDGPHMGGQHMGGRPPMDGHGMAHWQRIDRGGRVPQRWWGRQFEIGNWGMYGFPNPGPDGRWIRYYDDALLLDRDGRVLDGRYGWDWDRYGADQWSYGDDGVPEYAGDYDERGPDDYVDDERYERREGPPPMRRMPPPPPGPGYGYGAGCGCGYGYGAPVLVSETIVTEPPVVEQRTYVTTVVERTRVVARRRAPSKLIRRAPAPPRPGERG